MSALANITEWRRSVGNVYGGTALQVVQKGKYLMILDCSGSFAFRGKPMVPKENKLGIRNRRNLDRLKLNYPATYTRYDKWGNPCDQKIAKVTEVSLKGVRLQSSFRVEPGEMLDVTLALGDNLVSFKGKAIHARLSKRHGFELGVSIEDIEEEQRAALIRFLSQAPKI